MKATKYFRRKSDMTAFAEKFRLADYNHWYLKTTLTCDHAIKEKRKGIVLVDKEQIVQRLIYCPICNVHGNSQEIHNRLNELNTESDEC
jgi:hypothetical protein